MIHVIRASVQDVKVGDEVHMHGSLNTLHVRDITPQEDGYLVSAEVRRGGPLGAGDDIDLMFDANQVVTLSRSA